MALDIKFKYFGKILLHYLIQTMRLNATKRRVAKILSLPHTSKEQPTHSHTPNYSHSRPHKRDGHTSSPRVFHPGKTDNPSSLPFTLHFHYRLDRDGYIFVVTLATGQCTDQGVFQPAVLSDLSGNVWSSFGAFCSVRKGWFCKL